MAGYQQVIIVGNLGRDPEMRYLQSGVPVCNFTVAVNQVTGSAENRTEKTVWFRVAAWRELGERCSQYLAKGRQVMVIGTVDARAYTDNSGQPQATLELTARDVRFLGSREDGGGQGQGGYDDVGAPSGSNVDDIPF
jgi:single-strand DNA-binding protein